MEKKKNVSFRKLLDEKIKQQIVVVLAEKLPSRCLILLKGSSSCLKTVVLIMIRSYKNIFAFTSMSASLAENAGINEKLA